MLELLWKVGLEIWSAQELDIILKSIRKKDTQEIMDLSFITAINDGGKLYLG